MTSTTVLVVSIVLLSILAVYIWTIVVRVIWEKKREDTLEIQYRLKKEGNKCRKE